MKTRNRRNEGSKRLEGEEEMRKRTTEWDEKSRNEI